ncbi:hypothetical protein QTG56_25495 (plasmid) [Rossellomorea sp. AcN35-11]|nr:hypothetical protein [Rossellomorea aquimaris]WJV31971.1 hypothetical protein QTG56_25495 [Rossellomorea sp. AcN35-11]
MSVNENIFKEFSNFMQGQQKEIRLLREELEDLKKEVTSMKIKKVHSQSVAANVDLIDPEKFYDTGYVSEVLNVHKETVRRWCRTGMLATVVKDSGVRKQILGSDLINFMTGMK